MAELGGLYGLLRIKPVSDQTRQVSLFTVCFNHFCFLQKPLLKGNISLTLCAMYQKTSFPFSSGSSANLAIAQYCSLVSYLQYPCTPETCGLPSYSHLHSVIRSLSCSQDSLKFPSEHSGSWFSTHYCSRIPSSVCSVNLNLCLSDFFSWK